MELKIEDLNDFSCYDQNNSSNHQDIQNAKNTEKFFEDTLNQILQPKKKKLVHFANDKSLHLRDGTLCRLKRGSCAPVAQQPPMSYDDILDKIGVINNNGKIHMKGNLNQSQVNAINQSKNIKQVQVQIDPDLATKKSSYIYNKYFQKELREENPQEAKPKNIIELQNMMLKQIIERKKIQQIKSRKLMIPSTNIDISGSSKDINNINHLFNFSNRYTK